MKENTWAKRWVIFPRGTWKDNIRSVIWDWRTHLLESSTCHSSDGEISACLSIEGEIRSERPAGLSRKPVSSLVCVLRPSHDFTKTVPTTEERYVKTLWLYTYLPQSSSSKNGIINYINLLISTWVFKQGLSFNLRWSLNKFPDFFRVGTFIDSTHMKL